MRFSHVAKLLILAVAVLFAAIARAQVVHDTSGAGSGISVTGGGDVVAKPDAVEIRLRVSGAAELTDDAIVKHRDARDRIMKAFDNLKIENLKADEVNVNVKSASSNETVQRVLRGNVQQQTNTPAQVEVAGTMRVRVSNISKMPPDDLMKLIGRLLDTAKDGGAGLGPSDEEAAMAYRYGRQTSTSMVKYVVTGAEKIREEAYQKAVDDARARAERLAKLHGVKLGPVTSVNETFVSSDSPTNVNQQPWELTQDTDPNSLKELSADSMAGTAFRVKLNVRFAIASSEPTVTEASVKR
jgi:uncharacterized protein YggE